MISIMEWFRAHILATIATILSIFILVIGVTAHEKSAVTPTGIKAWSGNNGTVPYAYSYFDTPVNNSTNTESSADIAQNIQQDAELPDLRKLNASGSSAPQKNPYGINAFTNLAGQTTPPAIKKPAATGNSFFSNTDFFIPRGIITVPPPPATRTPAEQKLFAYGNDVGFLIKMFEDTHRDSVASLDAFFSKRTDQSGINKVLSMAGDYAALSTRIAGIPSIPEDTTSMNTDLARSYGNIATGLTNLTHTTTDDGLIEAIKSYDATVEEFIGKFVALADFFSARGIKFSSSDLGSIFTFSPTSL